MKLGTDTNRTLAFAGMLQALQLVQQTAYGRPYDVAAFQATLHSVLTLDADNVEAALLEILQAFEVQHYLGSSFNPGQHRTIRQPDLGTGRVMLFDSRGNGAQSARFRIFADGDDVWFTMNADWEDNQWEKDSPGNSGGFRFGRTEFEILHDDTSGTTFTEWSNRWRLPMNVNINSAFEAYGDIQEHGRVGMRSTNSYSATRWISMGGCVTFRVRFPATPSSITLTETESSDNWSGTPTVIDANRDGFAYYDVQQTASSTSTWWYSNYTAIA